MEQKSIVIYYTTFGSTGKVANAIASCVGCKAVPIELVHPYSKAGAVTRGVVDSGVRRLPKIKSKIDISHYDTVYLGTPVWGWTVSVVMQSFLKDLDLSGKTVIPFCTDDGQPGNFEKDMRSLCEAAASIGSLIEVQYARKKTQSEINAEVEAKLK